MLFGNRLGHELEERMLVSCLQRIVIFPVHLKLANGVFMVVLVGFPAQFQHVVTNFGDHIIAAHNGLLVVAGLFSSIIGVRNLAAIGERMKNSGSTPVFT